MDRHARTPEPLSMHGDMTENWRNWREDFLIFMTVTEYNKKSSEMKANLLKNLIGKVGLQVINCFTYNHPSDKDDFGIILSKLDHHFDPPKTETELRYVFFTIKRQAKDSIEDYINTLREKAKVCNFGPLTESLIRDKAVLDTKDPVLRKKYMSIESLTVDKLIAMGKEHESMVRKIRQISKESVDGKFDGATASRPNERRDGCWRCGRRHPPKNCPAWGAKCEKCGEKGHFGHCCPKNKESDKGKSFDKNLFDTFYQNNTTKKDTNDSFASLEPTPSTSTTPNSNHYVYPTQSNDKKLPNNISGQPKSSQQSVPTQSGVNTNQQLPKSNLNATRPAQVKKESEFVLVPPPTNNPFNHHQRQQPNTFRRTPFKHKPKKNDECVIS